MLVIFLPCSITAATTNCNSNYDEYDAYFAGNVLRDINACTIEILNYTWAWKISN